MASERVSSLCPGKQANQLNHEDLSHSAHQRRKGSMGHGSMGQFLDESCWSVQVDPRPTIISSAQQVTVKYRQTFTINTHGSLLIAIFQNIRTKLYNELFKSQFFCVALLHIILHTLCTVLYTHVYGSRVMHNGSWVSFCMGQWVMGHCV